MPTAYLFRAKNPMLHHCSESFYKAMITNADLNEDHDSINYLYSITFKNSWLLIKKIINLQSEDRISIFLFLIQSDYLILTLILKLISKIYSRKLKIYYLMHEPRFEKGRINPIKAFIVFLYHLLFGYLADKILLPSDLAVLKAKNFIKPGKLYKINLSFISPPARDLEKNLAQLKFTWNHTKTFSLLGRVDVDKNPQGFLDLANQIKQNYPEKARFIRAGRDRNIEVPYDEQLIIRFPSFISSSAKEFLLGLTHFAVIPYSFSTQSGVIAEALSYGKLLIINDIHAFSYLKGLKFVFIVDFNDNNAIVKCIHEIFNMDVDDYETRYLEAIKYFESNHSVNYLSKELSKIL